MSSGWREPDDAPHACPGSGALGIVVVEPGESFVDIDIASLKGFQNAEPFRIHVRAVRLRGACRIACGRRVERGCVLIPRCRAWTCWRRRAGTGRPRPWLGWRGWRGRRCGEAPEILPEIAGEILGPARHVVDVHIDVDPAAGAPAALALNRHAFVVIGLR